MERWSGTWRGLVAPLRRRPRCLSWSRARHRGQVWLLVSLANVVRPHKRRRQGRMVRTPAMAIGLTDHVWSSREYGWLPGHAAPILTEQLDERMAPRLTPALPDQPPGRTHACPAVETSAKEVVPRSKAAGGVRYCSPGLPSEQETGLLWTQDSSDGHPRGTACGMFPHPWRLWRCGCFEVLGV